MKSVGKHSSWSTFLFLDKLHCANGVASLGVSIFPELGVSGGDGIARTFSTIFGALTSSTIFFFAIRKFWKPKKLNVPEKRLFPTCHHTPIPKVADPNRNTLSSNTYFSFFEENCIFVYNMTEPTRLLHSVREDSLQFPVTNSARHYIHCPVWGLDLKVWTVLAWMLHFLWESVSVCRVYEHVIEMVN